MTVAQLHVSNECLYILLCLYEKELFSLCDFPGNNIIQCKLIFESWNFNE